MNKFIEQVINETFRSKRQQRYFYAKADDPKETPYQRDKWKKKAEEFSSKTDFDKLPEKAEEQEVDEIVDADGNIKTGDESGNPNGYIRSKKTSDEVSAATMGQMGTYGILGGPSPGGGNTNSMRRFWGESDMSKALGAQDTIMNPKVDNYEDAEEYFEDELEVSPEEAKDRVEKLGYDPELPDGKIRLIEDPKKYIKEYLAKKTNDSELVPKSQLETQKKVISPIIKRQLGSIKQSLKNNNLTVKDITEYLEDNE